MMALPRLAVLLASAVMASGALAATSVPVPRADGATTPLLVYEPASTKDCPPLLLISHGAGGSEQGYRYLAEAMQRDGWLAIVMGHRESGSAPLRADIRAQGLKQGIGALVADAGAYRARFMDIDAARQWAGQRCRAPYTALLGHSMGAVTVMLVAGARNLLGVQGEGGFDAYVALSPEGPGRVFPADAWASIHAPMLLITGTRDGGLDGDYQWRTQAFDGLGPGCRWLGVIDGGSHLNFAGLGVSGKTEQATVALTQAYLDALRAGHCGAPPSLPGVRVRSK
ncbi:alpha/beta hydrolase family protein [Dyella soli]|uniref:Alpha/beta hydrolase n=1 Tax=Dyella soli TaxID=522319 RepID=A0A4R0YGN3_9GAMM|nr:alpha/beta hydrolase [Dyella soli]TCI07406.1 alpha/beta hydrolase [Dyella soli]